MNREPDSDRLLERLRELPSPKLDERASARMVRAASREFDAYARGPAWLLQLGRAWSDVGLPAVLVACGVAYLLIGVSSLVRVFGPGLDAGTATAALSAPEQARATHQSPRVRSQRTLSVSARTRGTHVTPRSRPIALGSTTR